MRGLQGRVLAHRRSLEPDTYPAGFVTAPTDHGWLGALIPEKDGGSPETGRLSRQSSVELPTFRARARWSSAGPPHAGIGDALSRARTSHADGPYTNLRIDAAREEAEHVNEGAPLAGFTLAVKDLIAVAGWPIGAGTRLREGAGPELQDAPVVDLLRRAGAILVGTAVLHEIALGVTGVNRYAGTPVNPHAPGCMPGGSSSGSAVAVADGSARVALSTDTGGSGRIPAAMCGVVGFKPAQGDYPLHGVLALAPTLDHVGIMARSVADVSRVHAVLARPVPQVERPPRVGFTRASLETASSEVARAVEQGLERLSGAGCAVSEVSLVDDQDVLWATSTIIFVEAAATYAAMRPRWASDVGPDVRARLEFGVRVPERDRVEAVRRGRTLARAATHGLRDIDVLLTPTVPILPPRLADADDPALPSRLVANTRLANLTGLPALSLPLGKGIGLQLTGHTSEQLLADADWVHQVLRRRDAAP